MTRNASVLSDFVFPALLMGCGCLGLVVINLITVQRSPAAPASKKGKAPDVALRPEPTAVKPRQSPRGMKALPRVTVASPTMGRPRVAALMRPAAAVRITLGFRRRRVELSEAEELRLSRVVAKGPMGPSAVTVQGHGVDRSSRRRARRRVRRVVRVLRKLGVAAERIATPAVTSVGESGRGDGVTVVIGQR